MRRTKEIMVRWTEKEESREREFNIARENETMERVGEMMEAMNPD